MKRKLLQKRQDKTFIRYIDTNKVQQGVHIFKRGDTDELQRIKEYAINNDLDVLAYSNIISLSKEQYKRYYRGSDISINKSNIYEIDTIFIDIDVPLYENYYQLQSALKDSGIINYQVFESASGNIHLYIKVVKFSDVEQYKVLVKTIGNYLEQKGIVIDASSSNPIQKTYLEGFRVLSKQGFSSKYIKELSHRGKQQTPFQVLKEMHQRGIKIEREYSIKYAMYLLQDELQYNYSGELHLSQLEEKYLVPKYTFSRGLRALQGFRAIEYKTIRGSSGYIQVNYYNENRFNRCIKQQMTRKQNFFYINVLQIFKVLRNVYLHLVNECCKYIEKSIGTFHNFISRYASSLYVQGLLSGNSGTKRDIKQVQKIQNEKIQQGERNRTLYKTLVRGKYQGLSDTELDELASDIHSRMEQSISKPFKKTEVESVLRWVKRITLYNKVY